MLEYKVTAENRHNPIMFNWTEKLVGKGSNEVGSF